MNVICIAAQITYSVRDHLSNTKKTLTKIISLTANNQVALPLQEVGEVVASVVSPSYNLRANLRETKQGNSTKRYVDIWAGHRIEVSCEVTDHHQAFYLDGECHTQVLAQVHSASTKNIYLL